MMNPVRSMLFTPGDRLDMLEKAGRSGTDAVIVDLEDAVSTDNKAKARDNLAALPPSQVPYYVRTNAADTAHFWDDVTAVGSAEVVGLILPKAESPAVISQIDGALTVSERIHGRVDGSICIIPLIESALGVRLTFDIASASPRVECVMFGGGEQGDLVADLGVEWTPEGIGLMHARSQVLLSARAAGVPYPMEAVFWFPQQRRLACRVRDGLHPRLRRQGRHPSRTDRGHQRRVHRPRRWSHQRKVLAAFEEAEAAGTASIALDGKMVDYAVARVARAIIARAEAAAGGHEDATRS
jgi:citrate lyase subunit beta/citryl-CoA lyase